MANEKAVMTIKRGDGQTHWCYVPIDLYEVGSILSFTAKLIPDTDNTDARAVIDKDFDDSDVDTISFPGYARYTLYFGAADVKSIDFNNGKTREVLKGEFQFISPSMADPVSWPGKDTYIETIVFADIKREVPSV